MTHNERVPASQTPRRCAPWASAALLLTLLAPGVNAGALELLQDNTDGTVGVYLKEVGGPPREAFGENTIFEGASTNKTMIHAHAMLEIQSGNATLDEMIPVALDMVGSCPQGTGVVMEPLGDVLRLMMQESDNARTQAVRDRFGDANIANTIAALGMVNTLLNPMQTLGCGDEALQNPNQLTAVDLGLLYEQILTGFLGEPTRDQMFDLMLNQSNSFYIDSMINTEALDVGLDAAETLAFKAAIKMAHKGGSYTLVPEGEPALEYRSLAGYIELPFDCDGGSTQFVYTVFVDGATDLDVQGTGSELNIFSAARELLRPVIREALESALCSRAPMVVAPEPTTLECNAAGGVAGDDPLIASWLGEASATDECDDVSAENDAPSFFPSACAPGMKTVVTFSATDSCDATGMASSFVSVQDTTAPALLVPADVTVECTSPDGADVELIASGTDTCNGVTFQNSRTGPSNNASDTFPIGETVVAWDAVDDCANAACGWTTVTVTDTTPPVVDCDVAMDTLWPPNHKLVDVGFSADVTDACDPDPQVSITVTSDEDPGLVPGAGGEKHCPDALACSGPVQLRAERAGRRDGRVYVIHVEATDDAGNVATCEAVVTVPRSMSPGDEAVDSGQDFDATTCDGHFPPGLSTRQGEPEGRRERLKTRRR